MQYSKELNSQAKEDKKNLYLGITSVWLGTTMEYVDFALYGLAAGLIFGEVFFPSVSPIMGLISSFATYLVGFIARPLGAIFFGGIGDRYGRKIVMISTIFLMGLSTTLIGLIPSYQTIGMLAPILLVILRLCQGFGAGAELSGGAIMLAEYSPVKYRGLVSSLIGLGSNSGTLIASLIWLLVLTLPKEDLMSWGWRVPFIASILIAGFALFIRQNMQESPVYLAYQTKIKNQVKENISIDQNKTFWQRNKSFWIMLGLRIGENGPSYMAQGFLVGYVARVLNMDKAIPTEAVLIASLLGFIVIPLSGLLSDKIGRRITYRLFCLAIMLYSFIAFYLLETKDPVIVIMVIVIGMCLASLGIFAVQAAYGVELFGVAHRYSKMAIAKEFGSIISGGSAPFIASSLFAYFGHWSPLAIYVFVTASIGFITTFYAPETKGRDLNLLGDAK